MADPYGPNRRFVAPASAGSRLSILLLTLLAIDIIWITLRSAGYDLLVDEPDVGVTKAGFLIDLFSFGILIALVALALKHVHRRHWVSLLGDPARLVPDFARVLAACLGLYLALIFIGWDFSAAQTRPLAAWLSFVPIALLGILVQTGAEELLYRGYIHQYCVVLLKRPLYWFAVPALAFGVSHAWADPSSTATIVAYVVWTTAFALAAIDLTARTGSLGAAWGFHMAVNVTAMLLAAQDGAAMSAAALFVFAERSSELTPSTALVVIGLLYELAFLFVLWLAARNAIRR